MSEGANFSFKTVWSSPIRLEKGVAQPGCTIPSLVGVTPTEIA